MKAIKAKLQDIKPNDNNPRLIKNYKFNKLVKSIKDFPEMLRIRPIVVNKDNIILGGNMRYEAVKAAGIEEVWIIKAENFTEDQEKEFIIKDNIGFGDWDWDLLGNEWENKLLADWGLDVWLPTEAEDLEDFFEDEIEEDEEGNTKTIKLQYTEDEYDKIMDLLKTIEETPEQLFRKSLGL